MIVGHINTCDMCVTHSGNIHQCSKGKFNIYCFGVRLNKVQIIPNGYKNYNRHSGACKQKNGKFYWINNFFIFL